MTKAKVKGKKTLALVKVTGKDNKRTANAMFAAIMDAAAKAKAAKAKEEGKEN